LLFLVYHARRCNSQLVRVKFFPSIGSALELSFKLFSHVTAMKPDTETMETMAFLETVKGHRRAKWNFPHTKAVHISKMRL